MTLHLSFFDGAKVQRQKESKSSVEKTFFEKIGKEKFGEKNNIEKKNEKIKEKFREKIIAEKLSEKKRDYYFEEIKKQAISYGIGIVDEKVIEKVIPRVVDEGWTVRQVQRYLASVKKNSSAKAVKASDYMKREEALSKKYNSKVRIGVKSITFSVRDEKELKKLLDSLA